MTDFWFKNPAGKFIFDVLVGAVIGAATAVLDLGPTSTFDEARSALAWAAILGARSAASTALVAAVRALKARNSP